MLSGMLQLRTDADLTSERISGTVRAASRRERVGPTTRRAADRHYSAVIAAEIHRMALQLRTATVAHPSGTDARVA
jgi:hypothetical protein